MKDLLKAVTSARVSYALARDVLADARLRLQDAVADASEASEAKRVAVEVAMHVQRLSTRGIASVVMRCLEAVYEEAYEFEVRFVRKGTRTEAELAFTQRGEDVDTLSGLPGGVIDVAAFALRLACIIMTPDVRRLVVLDEPFQRVNGLKYRKRVAGLLESLTEELGFQFLIVTGTEEYRVGTVIDLKEVT